MFPVNTILSIDAYKGDGPFFLFSNAMDTYRNMTLTLESSREPQTISAEYAQRLQRYQRIRLVSQQASVTFVRVGFKRIRLQAPPKSVFTCSNELLNTIWRDCVKTVDMCTVTEGETALAWEVTESGTRVFGQHWAPCRRGTRWGDKSVHFQVRIEAGGASWGIHMVANGLIFCLDIAEKVLYASEGLSHTSTIFPVAEKGRWQLEDMPFEGWLDVKTIAKADAVMVAIQGRQVVVITGLDLHPLLGGSANNTGSVAFGGPCGWISQYRNLQVHDGASTLLYENDLLLHNRDRTLADFQVGSNSPACTIDGAKRDRACFGGDLYVMGRSIAFSTMNFAAFRGSIDLLTNHQTKDGYLGNLCPIQAPMHDGEEEPPTYAFYSLTYALLLVVAIKDYWLHTGDNDSLANLHDALEKLIGFVDRFVTAEGVVAAPPPLSMHWFPVGVPIFGASGPLNVAYYEALQAMKSMSVNDASLDRYHLKAETLKMKVQKQFCDTSSGNLRLSNSVPVDGVCQSTSAHARTVGIVDPLPHTNDSLCDKDPTLPRAFRNLAHWSAKDFISPYATGFAVEALLSRSSGPAAVDLLERVWGTMADIAIPNYSGGHWESMRPDGLPHSHGTSLMHEWSTWPVFLMPRYSAGLHPIEAGWKVFGVAPVLASLRNVECVMDTVTGTIKVEFNINEEAGHGTLRLLAPQGSTAELQPPQGWKIQEPISVKGDGEWGEYALTKIELEMPATTTRALRRLSTPASDEVKSMETSSKLEQAGFFQYLRTLWLSCFR